MGIEGERIPAGRAPRSKRGRRLQGSETATVAVHRYGQRAASRCCLSAPRLKTLSSASLSLLSLSAVHLSCTTAAGSAASGEPNGSQNLPFTVSPPLKQERHPFTAAALASLAGPGSGTSRGANAAAPRSPRSQPRHNFAAPASANHASAPRPNSLCCSR